MEPQPNRIQLYAQQVLELGLLFKNFEAAYLNPDRRKMLRILKLAMVVIWADSPQSKYADEILRLY